MESEISRPQEMESSHEEKLSTTTKSKAKNIHPRRFNDEQIKSLESIFMQETKLDPRKKLQIARDLDLQPRQVAIWFQNKRARWRLKQMEQEYTLLTSNYNTLSMRFEALKKENFSLQMQLQDLNDLVKNLNNVGSIDYPNSSTEEMDHDNHVINISRDDDEKMVATNEVVKWDEEEISQTWRTLSSSIGLFDQSSENSNWWES